MTRKSGKRTKKRKLKVNTAKSHNFRARQEYKKHTDLLGMIAKRLDETTGFLLRLEELDGNEPLERALRIMKKQNEASKMSVRVYLKIAADLMHEKYGRKEDGHTEGSTQEEQEPVQGIGLGGEVSE